MKTNWRFTRNFVMSTSLLSLTVFGFQNCSPLEPIQHRTFSSSNGLMNQSATPFSCQPSADPAPVSARRLTKTEYVNTIKTLLSKQASADLSAILSGLQPLFDSVPEDAGAKFNRTDSSIDQAHISAYFYVADKLGSLLTTSDARAKAFFGTCGGVADLSSTCLNTFLSGNATKIYRRPLTAAEMDGLKNDFAAYVSGGRTPL